MEHMFSSKGKQLLVINNYKFRFHKKLSKNVERWCCANSKCKSYLKLTSLKTSSGSHRTIITLRKVTLTCVEKNSVTE